MSQNQASLDHDPHRPANLGAGHTVRPDQFRRNASAEQVHLSLAVACEDMDMRGRVIVEVDNDAEACGTQNGDHAFT